MSNLKVLFAGVEKFTLILKVSRFEQGISQLEKEVLLSGS